jgi:predicted metal-dependent enzyme (double-stranded beta helix superfamily)
MFETARFIEECREALLDTDPQAAVRELVASAVAQPGPILHALGEPTLAGVHTLHKSPELTVLNLVWGPQMDLHPHDHRMWAVIGIYGGREDNTFWSRAAGGLTRQRMKTLEQGDAVPLGEKVIHSVRNPLQQLTAALHVYGGNFFETPRSEWDAHTLKEHPYSVQHTMDAFEASNAQLRAMPAGSRG